MHFPPRHLLKFLFFSFQSAYFQSLPYLIMGGASLVAAVSSLFLPETAGMDLPDTVYEIENFEKKLSFFFMPILHGRPGEEEEEEEARKSRQQPADAECDMTELRRRKS